MSRSRLTEMLDEFHAELDEPPGHGQPMRWVALMVEESSELLVELRAAAMLESAGSGDLVFRGATGLRVDIARELADVVYVAFGTARALNIDLDVALEQVHRSAMRKVCGHGQPLRRSDGKVLKPVGFVPPDLTEAVC